MKSPTVLARYLCLLIALSSLALSAQNADQYKQDLAIKAKLKKVVDNYTTLNWFNGVVLVSNESKPIYQSTSGFANRDYHIPNSLSTRYNLGLVTQVFTATAIMQLVEAQKINPKALLSEYMPEIASRLEHDITIHQLLNHTSGLTNYYESNRYKDQFLKIKSLTDLVNFIVEEPMFTQPGHALDPSPSNYVLLAALIEKITDMPYHQYIEQHILAQADMQNTKLGAWNERVANKATAYIQGQQDQPKVASNLWGAHPFGSEGIYSNALDLWKFTQAFFGGQLVANKQKNMMLRNYEYVEEATNNKVSIEDGYSYGWRTKQLQKHKIIYQNSFSPGLNVECRVYDDRERTYTLILLSNLDTDRTEELANEIDQVICQPDYEAPIAAISLLAQKIIEEQDVFYFVDQFDTLLNQYGLKLEQVMALKNAGEHFQKKSDLTTALALFKLNAKHFPHNDMVYNDLGNIHLLLENYSEALVNFEKHLALVNTVSWKKRRALVMIDKAQTAQAKAQEEQATEVLNSLITEGKPTPATIHTDRFMMPFPTATETATSPITPKEQPSQNENNAKAKTTTDLLLLKDKTNANTVETTKEKSNKNNVINETFEDTADSILQTPPQFPGGKQALKTYLKTHLQHPLSKSEQVKNKRSTTVYISFIIDKSGELKNIQVLKSMKDTQYYYDKEALRVVREMPKWEPGSYKGNPVQAYYLLPIEFN